MTHWVIITILCVSALHFALLAHKQEKELWELRKELMNIQKADSLKQMDIDKKQNEINYRQGILEKREEALVDKKNALTSLMEDEARLFEKIETLIKDCVKYNIRDYSHNLRRCIVWDGDVGPYINESVVEKHQIDQKKIYISGIERDIKRLNSATEQIKSSIDYVSKSFDRLSQKEQIEISSSMYADIISLKDYVIEEYLKDKDQPAYKAAEVVSNIKKEKRELLKQLKIMQYEYELLCRQLPQVADYADSVEEVLQELADVTIEQNGAKDWLTKEEWNKLSETERNQLALDRYNAGKRKKSNTRVGFDYELYCGHHLVQGTIMPGRGIDKVNQNGIQSGKCDCGRDIIAEGNGKTYIIQCKCWKKDRPIRENTIMQLYGSAAEYCIDKYGQIDKNPLKRLYKDVIPVLITTTSLSEEAQKFANYLGIEVHIFKFNMPYPQIKCNVSKDGERIYHLPFDQQYDATVIEKDKGECYVSTVQEAEKLGFRHAMRYITERN